MNAIYWYPLAALIAPQYGLPPELVCAVIEVESGGNPKAVSKAGAVGLMQVMPREAGESFRDRPPAKWLKHPVVNIAVGCEILRSYIAYYMKGASTPEEKRLALWKGVAAYYAGIGNVPREGAITHDGAARYVELVKGALQKLFPLKALELIGG